MDEFTRFNIGEVITWLIFGLISLVIFIQADNSRKIYWFLYAILFLFLGISDLLEFVISPESVSLLLGVPWWLFLWKLACAEGIVATIIFHMRRRIKEV